MFLNSCLLIFIFIVIHVEKHIPDHVNVNAKISTREIVSYSKIFTQHSSLLKL